MSMLMWYLSLLDEKTVVTAFSSVFFSISKQLTSSVVTPFFRIVLPQSTASMIKFIWFFTDFSTWVFLFYIFFDCMRLFNGVAFASRVSLLFDGSLNGIMSRSSHFIDCVQLTQEFVFPKL